MSVDATPPETPATICSYFTWANTLNFLGLPVDGALIGFIVRFLLGFLCASSVLLLLSQGLLAALCEIHLC